MSTIRSLINFKTFLDISILSLIFLLVSVMGGIGFDFAISNKIVSLHSLKNVLVAAIFFWFIRKAIDKEIKFKKTGLDLPVLIYFLTFIFAIFFSSQPKVSLLYFRDFILYAGMAYLLINNIKNEEKLEAMLFILLISVLHTVGYGIIQHLKTQLGSSDGNYYSFVGRAEFGAVAVLTVPILAGFFLNYRKTLKTSFLYIIGLIVLITGIVFSYSRGSWIGLITIIFFYIIIHNRVLKDWKVITLKVLIIIFLFLVLPSSIEDRIKSIENYTKTSGDRIPAWKSSLTMIKDFPFLGIGPGTFDINYPKYKTPEALENWGEGWHAHNIFLHIASENGIIGLVSFLTVIAVSFKKYFKLKNKIENNKLKNLLDAAIVSLIGYIACSQTTIFFANHNKNEKISMFLWFDIALIFIIERISRDEAGG